MTESQVIYWWRLLQPKQQQKSGDSPSLYFRDWEMERLERERLEKAGGPRPTYQQP